MANETGNPRITVKSRIESLRRAMETERSSWVSHWRDIANYLLPRRARFQVSDQNRGDRRNQKIIDSTARFAARTLSAGMHAGLTSPARPWFKLSVHDPELAKFAPVKRWLHEVTMRMLAIFAQTNIYNAFPVTYTDLGVFGTGAMSILPDSQDVFRAYNYPVGSYAIGLDARGLTSTFVHEYQMSVEQIVETFGGEGGQPLRRGAEPEWTNISTHVRTLYERTQLQTMINVVWMVKPNEDFVPDAIGRRGFRFASYHYERGDSSASASSAEAVRENQFLRQSGYHTFPVMTPRWDITGGDIYGTDCPGMVALGDIMQLQGMERKKAVAVEKGVHPSLVAPLSMEEKAINLLPGGVTYVDVREGFRGVEAMHEVTMNLEHLRLDMDEVRFRIQRAFYEDLFLMIARSDSRLGADRPTAREIDVRQEEKFLALGPVVERTDDELLDPIIDRVFDMMLRAGMFPEPPSELDGVNLKVEFISILNQAQKFGSVAALDRFLTSTLPLAEVFPDIPAKIDGMAVVDEYHDTLGVNPTILRTTEEARSFMQAQQQAQAEAQAAEQAATLAKAAKDASAANLESDNVLRRLVSR